MDRNSTALWARSHVSESSDMNEGGTNVAAAVTSAHCSGNYPRHFQDSATSIALWQEADSVSIRAEIATSASDVLLKRKA
eukprot:5216233-Amphidinium_carterae.1